MNYINISSGEDATSNHDSSSNQEVQVPYRRHQYDETLPAIFGGRPRVKHNTLTVEGNSSSRSPLYNGKDSLRGVCV